MLNRKMFFYLIMTAPMLFVITIISVTAYDLYSIRHINQEEVIRNLQLYLSQKIPETFPLPENMFVRPDKGKTVFVFGESSLVLTDGSTFSEYLTQEHNDLHVVNFGVSGLDSLSVRQRVAQALTVARPDIIILYYGHNDYNNAYNGFIIPMYFAKFNILLRLSHLFHDRDKPVGVLLHQEYYWYSRLTRPLLYRFFVQIGLVDVKSDWFASVNQNILNYFSNNNSVIMVMAESMHVPVVLITPVGNLHAEPFGDTDTTSQYRKGMASANYIQSLRHLIAAKDSEFLTYDLRAKSELIDYIRNFKRQNVYVLDLQKKLEDLRFGFGYDEFLDYFHFKDSSHKLLADEIYSFMQEKGLVEADRPN